MPTIQSCEVPPEALLAKLRLAGAYTDCFSTEVPWPVRHEVASGTRLDFGSAVGLGRAAEPSHASMGTAFNLLLSFHKLYSRILLGAARARLARMHTARA